MPFSTFSVLGAALCNSTTWYMFMYTTSKKFFHQSDIDDFWRYSTEMTYGHNIKAPEQAKSEAKIRSQNQKQCIALMDAKPC